MLMIYFFRRTPTALPTFGVDDFGNKYSLMPDDFLVRREWKTVSHNGSVEYVCNMNTIFHVQRETDE